MASRSHFLLAASAICIVAVVLDGAVDAQQPFTSSYTDGGSWNMLYGQGFNAFVNDNPEVMHEFGDPISLSRFEFFKAGDPDEASDIQLAIVSNFFLNLEEFTTSSPELVGLSSNTIPSTANLALGDPIRFDFEDLTINFGDYYGAIFVNVDEMGDITPVLVSSLHTDYVETEPGSGEFIPESNYDFDPDNPTDYLTSTSNFLNTDEFGTFLVGFEGSGDANFIAYYDYTFASGGPGDFDEDGDVDGDDLNSWQSAYGVSEGADADDDGDSDGADFLVWQRNYGTGSASIGVVPEPTATALLAIGFVVFGAGRIARFSLSPRS